MLVPLFSSQQPRHYEGPGPLRSPSTVTPCCTSECSGLPGIKKKKEGEEKKRQSARGRRGVRKRGGERRRDYGAARLGFFFVKAAWTFGRRPAESGDKAAFYPSGVYRRSLEHRAIGRSDGGGGLGGAAVAKTELVQQHQQCDHHV